MGKVIIGISIIVLPIEVSLIIIFSDTLGLTGIALSLAASVFVFLCGLYAGYVGVKYEHLQKTFDAFVNPLRIRPKDSNLIKAICPVDHEQVVFVHVSPHRDDAQPDGLDIFVGSCGHEVHRAEIEIERQEPLTS